MTVNETRYSNPTAASTVNRRLRSPRLGRGRIAAVSVYAAESAFAMDVRLREEGGRPRKARVRQSGVTRGAAVHCGGRLRRRGPP